MYECILLAHSWMEKIPCQRKENWSKKKILLTFPLVFFFPCSIQWYRFPIKCSVSSDPFQVGASKIFFEYFILNKTRKKPVGSSALDSFIFGWKKVLKKVCQPRSYSILPTFKCYISLHISQFIENNLTVRCSILCKSQYFSNVWIKNYLGRNCFDLRSPNCQMRIFDICLRSFRFSISMQLCLCVYIWIAFIAHTGFFVWRSYICDYLCLPSKSQYIYTQISTGT